MIYLIITACIFNRFGQKNAEQRKTQYLTAISQTLTYLPSEIIPIIVENNGPRETYLDHFVHHNQPVRVIYTTNNQYAYQNKGVNELMDVKAVLHELRVLPDDMIIKWTGRYRALSSHFFEEIQHHVSRESFDGFVKYYNVDTLQWDDNHCVLGCYAMTCQYLMLWNAIHIERAPSAEYAFARYSRICGARIKRMEQLDVECCFADDFRILTV